MEVGPELHCQDCNALKLVARIPYDSRPSDSDARPYDDASRWTEEQARDVAGHIIRQSQRDAEFVKTALARLAIP